MSSFLVEAKSRNDLGKGAMRRLRSTGQIPGVVYGGGAEPQAIELRHDDMLHSLESEAFFSSILSLKIDGNAEKVVLRDIQRHPAKPTILHADFQRVSSKSEITMSVPVHYLNSEIAAGVKTGGILDVLFNELSIRCLAKDLPEAIEIDVTDMEIGDSITYTQVKLPKGVALSVFVGMDDEEITSHDQTIASLHEPKVVIESEDIAETEDEAEGEGKEVVVAEDDNKES